MTNFRSILYLLKRINKKTLTIFVIALMGIVLIFGGIFHAHYIEARSNIVAAGKEGAILSAQEFNKFLVTSIDATELVAYTIDNLLEDKKDSDYILDYLKEETQNYENAISDNYTGIYGYVNGEYLDGTGWVPEDDYEPKERPWYKAAIAADGEIALVTPYVDAETGQIMMTVSKMLSDGESAVAMDLTLDRLQEITDEIRDSSSNTDYVMVLDSQGLVVAMSGLRDADDQERLRLFEIADAVKSQLGKNGLGDFEIAYEDTKYIVYAEPVQTDWSAISVLDEKPIFGHLRKIEIASALLLLVILGAVVMVFLSMSRRQIEMEELNIRLQSAASIYDAVYMMDLKEDTYEYISGRNISGMYPGEWRHDAKGNLRSTVAWLSDEQTREAFEQFVNFDNFDVRMEQTDTITMEFLDRENHWCRARFVAAERSPDNSVHKTLFMVELIDEERRERDKLQYLSEIDRLTGINNRGSGETKISQLLETGTGGMFILLDADHFKSINDNYGHGIGDKVIISIAQALKKTFRENDVVLRLGGDEFAAFAPGICTPVDGREIVDGLIECVGGIEIPEMKGRKIEISVGVAFYQMYDKFPFEELYKRADRCTYLSKKHLGSYATYHYSLV